jgi:uncharacterized protein YcbX
MQIGTLAAIRRYPVKSLRGEVLQSVEVEAFGIGGDRERAFFSLEGARAGKAYRGKENDRLHLASDAGDAAVLAQERGHAVELRKGDHFFDDAPISIVVDVWMNALNEHLGYAVEWERFRPNFFVRAIGSIESEETFQGVDLRLGRVRLRVRSPIERCVAVTYHPVGEPSDPRILRYLAQERNALLGIYCDVVETGTATVGDSLLKE